MYAQCRSSLGAFVRTAKTGQTVMRTAKTVQTVQKVKRYVLLRSGPFIIDISKSAIIMHRLIPPGKLNRKDFKCEIQQFLM